MCEVTHNLTINSTLELGSIHVFCPLRQSPSIICQNKNATVRPFLKIAIVWPMGQGLCRNAVDYVTKDTDDSEIKS